MPLEYIRLTEQTRASAALFLYRLLQSLFHLGIGFSVNANKGTFVRVTQVKHTAPNLLWEARGQVCMNVWSV